MALVGHHRSAPQRQNCCSVTQVVGVFRAGGLQPPSCNILYCTYKVRSSLEKAMWQLSKWQTGEPTFRRDVMRDLHPLHT